MDMRRDQEHYEISWTNNLWITETVPMILTGDLTRGLSLCEPECQIPRLGAKHSQAGK